MTELMFVAQSLVLPVGAAVALSLGFYILRHSDQRPKQVLLRRRRDGRS